jgi:hypothetical protein
MNKLKSGKKYSKNNNNIQKAPSLLPQSTENGGFKQAHLISLCLRNKEENIQTEDVIFVEDDQM